MSTEASTSRGYHAPEKEILTKAQLEQFQQSATHSQLLAFIERLNEAVIGVKLRDPCEESDVCSLL
jgi:serine/threonine-protein phosphatase 2A activator